MKYCTHCGKELFDEAVICIGCGCPVEGAKFKSAKILQTDGDALLNTLAQRLNINGIIWLVIGILQILGGLFINWFLLIIGVLNIVSSVKDVQYSKTLQEDPKGIVDKFEPITGPVITLVYNIVFGGLIGVIGSIYYFVAIRNFVMTNKQFFASLDVSENPDNKSTSFFNTSVKAATSTTPPAGCWICNRCGTENSTNYGQCKKCGIFRSC